MEVLLYDPVEENERIRDQTGNLEPYQREFTQWMRDIIDTIRTKWSDLITQECPGLGSIFVRGTPQRIRELLQTLPAATPLHPRHAGSIGPEQSVEFFEWNG